MVSTVHQGNDNKNNKQEKDYKSPSKKDVKHKDTEKISLSSSDNEFSSSGIEKEGLKFSKKSMSQLKINGQSGNLNSTNGNQVETSSCSYTESNKGSISLQELSENIKSKFLLNNQPQKQPEGEKSISKITASKIANKEKNEIEIKRMKLISYLGNRINETPIEEIEEAISKMLFLNEVQFKNLLEDILLQIEIRGIKKQTSILQNKETELSSFSTEKQIDSKLSNLNTKQFKKLCLDVFYVFEAKYPSNKINKYSKIIKNLEVSLKEITNKIEMMDETEEIIYNIESETSPIKQLNFFLEHLKKVFLIHNIETNIILRFEKLFLNNLLPENKYINDNNLSDVFSLNLLDPNFLLKITENSFNMKIQSQRKILCLIIKKYNKKEKNSKKLDNPYKYILRKETINLLLLLETKRPSFKEIINNLSKLFNHLTFCYLNESNIFTTESFLLFNYILKNIQNIETTSCLLKFNKNNFKEDFIEFEEFKLKVKQKKLSKKVLNDELERLIINISRKLLLIN